MTTRFLSHSKWPFRKQIRYIWLQLAFLWKRFEFEIWVYSILLCLSLFAFQVLKQLRDDTVLLGLWRHILNESEFPIAFKQSFNRWTQTYKFDWDWLLHHRTGRDLLWKLEGTVALQLFELVPVSQIPPEVPFSLSILEWRRATKKLMFRLIPVEDVYFAVHKSYLLFPSLIFGFHLVGIVRVNVAILRSHVLVRLA